MEGEMVVGRVSPQPHTQTMQQSSARQLVERQRYAFGPSRDSTRRGRKRARVHGVPHENVARRKQWNLPIYLPSEPNTRHESGRPLSQTGFTTPIPHQTIVVLPVRRVATTAIENDALHTSWKPAKTYPPVSRSSCFPAWTNRHPSGTATGIFLRTTHASSLHNLEMAKPRARAGSKTGE